jgi:predicted membrane protein
MIRLKEKINKSEIKRQLLKDAEYKYKSSWQPDLQILAFMDGVECALKEVQLKENHGKEN